MITTIIQLLHSHTWEGVSERVEIAKGKNKLQTTIKGKANQLRREQKWQKRK